jgi:exodeoxyribonuclease VII large subunit
VQIVKRQRESLLQTNRRLRELGQQRLRDLKTAFYSMESRLSLLGPEQVLSRGYSITTDAATGKVLRDASQVNTGQRLKTRLKKGEVFSKAEK